MQLHALLGVMYTCMSRAHSGCYIMDSGASKLRYSAKLQTAAAHKGHALRAVMPGPLGVAWATGRTAAKRARAHRRPARLSTRGWQDAVCTAGELVLERPADEPTFEAAPPQAAPAPLLPACAADDGGSAGELLFGPLPADGRGEGGSEAEAWQVPAEPCSPARMGFLYGAAICC
jgi:hypothetical protein